MLFWGNWVLGNRGWHVMQLAQGEKLEYQKYTNAVKDIIMLDGPNHRGAYLGVSGEGAGKLQIFPTRHLRHSITGPEERL